MARRPAKIAGLMTRRSGSPSCRWRSNCETQAGLAARSSTCRQRGSYRSKCFGSVPGLPLSAVMLKPSGNVCWRSLPRSPATPPPGPGSPSWRKRRDGSADAESFRKKQAEASDLRERYTQLFMIDDRSRHADELADAGPKAGTPDRSPRLVIDQRKGGRGRAALARAGGPRAIARLRQAAGAFGRRSAATRQRAGGPALARQRRHLPAFTDDAEAAGLRFNHDNGHTSAIPPPTETMCGGVGLLDYDGDGWLDVYAVQAGPFPPTATTHYEGDRLFRNRSDGTFEDVTDRTGIGSFPRGYGHGVAVGDYDNDGRPDLFVTRWHSYALYRNQGDGHVRGRDGQGRARAAIATGRRRRRSPTWMATAISISTSATTSSTIPPTQALQASRLAERANLHAARFSLAARSRLSQ